MPNALLDSSTYIDLERTFKHRTDPWAANTTGNLLKYTQASGRPYLSIVSVIEILRGLHRDVASGKAERFKKMAPSNFQFLDITTEIGYLSGEIMERLESARQSIGFPDTLIAATAIHHGLILVTSNSRHFKRVVNAGFPLTMQNWREP